MLRTVVMLVLALGLAVTAQAQTFGPKNYPDCIMLYSKKAASLGGETLLRRACKCRFQDPSDSSCRQYSKPALDCMIKNLLPVEDDAAAWGVERACRTKHPVQ